MAYIILLCLAALAAAGNATKLWDGSINLGCLGWIVASALFLSLAGSYFAKGE